MELLIKNRDYVPDGTGGFVRVSGKEELLQRVLFQLSARRGGFAPLPDWRDALGRYLAAWDGKNRKTAPRRQKNMWRRRCAARRR